ncbi:transglutaminase domain-containing protein [Blautia sp. MSJ-19]|uniref:transglutaminase domain-containing protein n=1 Tax=Blautia sp. MSJ-19 TaxID=2841517 RepID=UPI001C0EBA36|nr:transglutaminase domain-containing protein [Blautia sp. MSJ-19]MBU5482335.1 transglutaminase-like superfamily [Blautia sp. MSJ-19]
MKRKRKSVWKIFLLLTVLLVAGAIMWVKQLPKEPGEVTELRQEEIQEADEGHQEYYFGFLEGEEKRIYREMLEGIRNRRDAFYLTSSDEALIGKAYHALLRDHAELFWVHNRQEVYTTSYQDAQYCRFSPGYTYSDEEVEEITKAMQEALEEVRKQIPEGADTYETVKTVYTYLIDTAEYEASEDDQNIAGIFWKKKAVCAGYARAVQYLLEELDIPCIYVEGSAEGSDDGHAWDIVQIDGKYYYVDATNGDQPSFLEGDAVQLAEHKTIIYDYLCPFPDEYEQVYAASEEFPVPECTACDYNFYVMNQACFASYDPQEIYRFCCMRLDNGAAVVRFKFQSQDDFESAYQQWIKEEYIQNVAGYYLELYGKNAVEYHYGVLDNLKTMYFMF